jgi:hypothetical protein
VPPTRFAFFQEFATLDFISRGRAEIVAGRGSFVESYPLFGLSLEDHDSLFAEKLDLFLKIRASTQVHWSGKHRAALTLPSNLPSPVAGSATHLCRCWRHSRIFLYSYVAPAHAGKIILDAYELLRLWVRRRVQQRSVHHAENRCRGSDAQGNRQNGDGGDRPEICAAFADRSGRPARSDPTRASGRIRRSVLRLA